MKIQAILNWPTTLACLLLLSIGTLVIFSSSKELAIQQGIFALVGLFLYFFISEFDYRVIKNIIFPLYLFSILLLILVLILGIETRGSIRWIPLGFVNIQPSEFAKPVLVLFLANFWSKRNATWRNIYKSLLWTIPLLLLIFKQPDLGTSLTIMAIWVGILYAARISFKKILILILLTLMLTPIIWFSLQNYQKQRIISFLSPNRDPLGMGYNIIQSTIAVGSGEFLGRGLGRGTQSRLQFLPEFRTDFIFASIAEEMGFLGSMIILTVYCFIISYIINISEKSYDHFGYLIAFGVASMLLFQTAVNVGMNIGLLPITGITLPMVSYGGSSLVATLICLGLIQSIAKFRRKFDISNPEG